MDKQIEAMAAEVFSQQAKDELHHLADVCRLVFDFFGGSKPEAQLFMNSRQDFLANKTPMDWFNAGRVQELKTELVKWLTLAEA